MKPKTTLKRTELKSDLLSVRMRFRANEYRFFRRANQGILFPFSRSGKIAYHDDGNAQKLLDFAFRKSFCQLRLVTGNVVLDFFHENYGFVGKRYLFKPAVVFHVRPCYHALFFQKLQIAACSCTPHAEFVFDIAGTAVALKIVYEKHYHALHTRSMLAGVVVFHIALYEIVKLAYRFSHVHGASTSPKLNAGLLGYLQILNSFNANVN